MSWDNVKGVSAAQIWTDNPDTTQAYLFANGNHQVKLTVGLSLVLTNTSQPGPTEDEIKAALSLIDFDTGAGLSHLKTGDKGEYGYVYLPNMPEQIKASPISDASNPGAYQYELDYYLYSDSTINADFASEKVALLLSYTDSGGKEIEYSTASGSKSQSYVTVTVYPPKKYGVVDSGSTPVIIQLKDDKPNDGIISHDEYVKDTSISSAKIYSLRIDDSFFRLIHLDASGDIESDQNAFYIDISKNGGVQSGYQPFSIHECFLVSENNLNQGKQFYTSTLYITPGKNQPYWFSVHVSVVQEPNEIIFINFSGNASTSRPTYSNDHSTASFSAYDQFGNHLEIEVAATNDGFSVNNVN